MFGAGPKGARQKTAGAADRSAGLRKRRSVSWLCLCISSTRMHRARLGDSKEPLRAPTRDSRFVLVSVARKGRNAFELMAHSVSILGFGRIVGLTGYERRAQELAESGRASLAGLLGLLVVSRSDGLQMLQSRREGSVEVPLGISPSYRDAVCRSSSSVCTAVRSSV